MGALNAQSRSHDIQVGDAVRFTRRAWRDISTILPNRVSPNGTAAAIINQDGSRLVAVDWGSFGFPELVNVSDIRKVRER